MLAGMHHGQRKSLTTRGAKQSHFPSDAMTVWCSEFLKHPTDGKIFEEQFHPSNETLDRLDDYLLRTTGTCAARQFLSLQPRNPVITLNLCASTITDSVTPFFSNSSPYSIALHVGDASPAHTLSSKLPCGQYLAFKTHAQRLSGWWISLHAWCAKSAWLNQRKSLKPIPPWTFGRIIVYHGTHWTLRLPNSEPHQNAWMCFMRSSQSVNGNLKTLII